MQPDPSIQDNRIIYVDHHFTDKAQEYAYTLYDDSAQSCSLILWDYVCQQNISFSSIIPFCAVLGFISDGGSVQTLPRTLRPFTEHIDSFFPYISLLNTPKRMHWNGDESVRLLCEIDSKEDFLQGSHTLIQKLESYKDILQAYYAKSFEVKSYSQIDFVQIEEPYNIQGVLCAKYMKKHPIIVMNKHMNRCIGSLRVPQNSTFDAGEFLRNMQEYIPEFIGGGHEKAAGFSFPEIYLDQFVQYIKK